MISRITPTLRRRQRRQRAVARLQWHRHRGGQIVLSSGQLQILYKRLSGHHSRDFGFLRRLRGAMAEVSKQPWRCHWCKRLNKHHVGVCGSCYAPWDKCIDIHYVHGQKKQPATQSRSLSRKKWQQSADWEEWENWSDSPRRRSDTPRQAYAQSPRKRTKAKKNQKDKHKKQTEQYGALSLDPPWQSTVQAVLPANAATGSASSVEGHLLQELVQAIETSDKPISSEVQMVMAKAKKAPEPPPPTAKSVRQAWDKLEKKRKQLQQAQAARANLEPISISLGLNI